MIKRNKNKKILNTKIHRMPAYDEKYIKAEVRQFNGVIKANVLGDEIPKEGVHYACIACIAICFCCVNEKKELSRSLFRRMQIQNKVDKDV